MKNCCHKRLICFPLHWHLRIAHTERFLCARESGRENRRLKFTTNGGFCNLAALEVGEEPGTESHAPSCASALPPPCCWVPRDSIAGTQEKPLSKPLPSASSRCEKGNVGVFRSQSCAPRRQSPEGGDPWLYLSSPGLYSSAIVSVLWIGKVLFLLCWFQPTDIFWFLTSWGAAFLRVRFLKSHLSQQWAAGRQLCAPGAAGWCRVQGILTLLCLRVAPRSHGKDWERRSSGRTSQLCWCLSHTVRLRAWGSRLQQDGFHSDQLLKVSDVKIPKVYFKN